MWDLIRGSLTNVANLTMTTSTPEDLYRAAAEAGTDSIFILRAIKDSLGELYDFEIAEANPKAAHRLGMTREQLIGLGVRDFIPTLGTVISLDKIKQVYLSGETWIEDLPVDTPSAHTLWLQYRISPIAGGAVVSTRNITEQKLGQARIEHLTHLYRAMREINHGIMDLPDASGLLALVCRALVETGGMRMAWIGCPNPAMNRIEPVEDYGSAADYLDEADITLDPATTSATDPATLAFLQQHSIIIDAGQEQHADWLERAARHGFRSAAAFPVRRAEHPFAILTLYSDMHNPFDAGAIALLEEMILDITFALDTFDGAQRHLANQEALRRSEESLALAQKVAGMGSWELDLETLRASWSAEMYRITGRAADIDPPMLDEFMACVHPDDQQMMLDHHKRTIEEGLSAEFEFRSTITGPLRQYLTHIEPLRDTSGQVTKIIGTLADITMRKQAEDALRESEERFRTLVADAPEAIVIHDVDSGLFVDATISAERLFACDREALLQLGPTDFFSPEQPPNTPSIESMRERGEYILRGGQAKFERMVRNAKGEDLLCEVRLIGLPSSGRRLIRASYVDITERKRAEEELRLYALVLQNSSEGMMVLDSERHIIAVNPAFSVITGHSLEEVQGEPPSMLRPENLEDSLLRAVWSTLSTSGKWQGEVWDTRKDGTDIALSLSINTVNHVDGSIQRYIALLSDVTEKKRSQELIWRQANFDTLTRLPNRNMFRDRMEQEIKKSDRSGHPLGLLLIDLDQFKEVNDTLGHDVGDQLLQEAARRISTCVRATDTVARLGGDEFCVLLSQLADATHVEDVAQKIIRSLALPFLLANETIYVSASIGITLYPGDATDMETLIKNADQAMYAAKNKGRNRSSYFTQSLQEEAQLRLRLISDLRRALEAKQFRVYFQPIVDMVTGRIHKVEALIRWLHPEHGMVGPQKFIPLAEETGLINEIGDWVFQESVRWVKRWRDLYAADFQVSVNKSPAQFRVEGNLFAASWLGHLKNEELLGKHIVIEITEGLLLNAENDVTDKLLKFRDAGIQVALDDFGTGYSSLSYLKKFDIDYLKIDQSFVRDLETDVNDMAVSEAIIVMAHKLGLKVIAEGVETEGQRRLLAAAGCDYAQGFLFARPLPPEELEELLKATNASLLQSPMLNSALH